MSDDDLIDDESGASASDDAARPWSSGPTPKERNAVQRLVEKLLDDLAPERAVKRVHDAADGVMAYRTPSGAVLQTPANALSVSWFPEPSEEAELGELHVVLWKGTVSRRGAPRPAQPAVVLRDLALFPVPRPADDAVWRTADGTTYDVAALTAHCLAMLEGQRDVDRT